MDLFHFCESQTIESDVEAPSKKGEIQEVDDEVENIFAFRMIFLFDCCCRRFFTKPESDRRLTIEFCGKTIVLR